MPKGVLIVTPYAKFGELLRLRLEESGRYFIRTVATAQEALAETNRNGIDVAILDSDLPDNSMVELGNWLRQMDPKIFLVVIPPQNNPCHPKLSGLLADGYLTKPFYLPALLETLDTLLDNRPPIVYSFGQSLSPSSPSEQLPGLQNMMLVTQFLSTLLLETSAHAAWLMAHDQILTCAGNLSLDTMDEASHILARSPLKTIQHELARFLHTMEDGDYLLYALPMTDELMLGLLFDATIRLTQARRQSLKLAHELASKLSQPIEPSLLQPLTGVATTEAFGLDEPEPLWEVPTIAPQSEGGEEVPFSGTEETAVYSTVLGDESQQKKTPLQILRHLLQDEWEPRGKEEIVLLLKSFGEQESQAQPREPKEVLTEVESEPVPTSGEKVTGLERMDELGKDRLLEGQSITPGAVEEGLCEPGEFTAQAGASFEQNLNQPLGLLAGIPPSDLEKGEPAEADQPGEELVEEQERSSEEIIFPWEEDSPANPIPPPDWDTNLPSSSENLATESTEITQPIGIRTSPSSLEDTCQDTAPLRTHRSENIDLPPDLTFEETQKLYTYVLVTQSDEYSLSGELAQSLPQWIGEICQSFGWQLEHVSVDAHELLWTVNLTSDTSPANVVRLIRLSISQRIIKEFPEILDIPSGSDIWAPGYLIARGRQQPEKSEWMDFMDGIRRPHGS